MLNLLSKIFFLHSLLPFDFSEQEDALLLQTKRLQSIEYMWLFLAQPVRQESTGFCRRRRFFPRISRGCLLLYSLLGFPRGCSPFWPTRPWGCSSTCTVLGKGGFLTLFWENKKAAPSTTGRCRFDMVNPNIYIFIKNVLRALDLNQISWVMTKISNCILIIEQNMNC